MENDETVEHGAMREMEEETNGRVNMVGLHTVYNVLPVNQVHLHFLVELKDLNYSLTDESIDIQLFKEEDIPWKEIAFASSRFALHRYFEDRKLGVRQIHLGTYSARDEG